MKLLEICFLKLIMDVLREVAMKLRVTPLSKTSSEIACEVAVKFCTIVFDFQRGTNFTGISFAISRAISLRGLLATSRQFHQQFHYQFHETNYERRGTRQTMKMRPIDCQATSEAGGGGA